MPALNFQAQFARRVKAGSKRCTIRAPRKRPINSGDTLYLYTGMRTEACRKLGEGICRRVTAIRISLSEQMTVWLGDRLLIPGEISVLAGRDGFANTRDFITLFEQFHGLPFAEFSLSGEP